jgi:hypothetical protein
MTAKPDKISHCERSRRGGRAWQSQKQIMTQPPGEGKFYFLRVRRKEGVQNYSLSRIMTRIMAGNDKMIYKYNFSALNQATTGHDVFFARQEIKSERYRKAT